MTVPNKLGFWDDWSFPDIGFDFSMPDFNFDFLSDTGGYEYIDDGFIPGVDMDFSMPSLDWQDYDYGGHEYIDDVAIPDFDLDQFFADFDLQDIGVTNPDSFVASNSNVGFSPSEGVPPVLDESGAVAGSGGSFKLDSLLKLGKEIFPVVKTAAGLFFSYQRSTNPQTGRAQYVPRQISQQQAAQMLAAQQAQNPAALAYRQQLQTAGPGGLLQNPLFPIILGAAALLVFTMTRKR